MRKVSARNRQWLSRELSVLETEGVVSPEAVRAVRSYYAAQQADGLHWAVLAFAAAGSLLIGLGIILLLAHNWDELGRPARAVLSFCPLVLGALVSCIALTRTRGPAWRESAGIFHTLSIGATLALIGQTYHIPAELPGFMLKWLLLSAPLLFILQSSGACLVYLAIMVGWCMTAQETYGHAAGFWLLIIPPVVRYAQCARLNRYGVGTLLHLWGLLAAGCFCLGLMLDHVIPGQWVIIYAAFFSLAGLLGERYYGARAGWTNPLKLFGILGMVVLVYLFTWADLWDGVGWDHIGRGRHYSARGIWLDAAATAVLVVGWIFCAAKAVRKDSAETMAWVLFPALALFSFILASLTNHLEWVNAIVFNGFLLLLGVMYIVAGCRNNMLRLLNGGMAILALLVVTRFFDSEFGFMARGVAFILLGAGFLLTNLVIAHRKTILEVNA